MKVQRPVTMFIAALQSSLQSRSFATNDEARRA